MDWTLWAGKALGRLVTAPRPATVPTTRLVELPGRGTTSVIDLPGPPDAQTLVLLHALGTTARLSWYPSLETLAERYRVVAFDQRWHGSGIRSREFRLVDCADDAVAVADLLGLDRFVVVGYSMGGAVAQLIWRRHRSRVAGLVLAATARNYRGKVGERLWFQLTRASMARFGGHAHGRVEQLGTRVAALDGNGYQDELSRWAMREFRSTSVWSMLAALDELGRFDSSAWIRRVDIPTSVIVMTRDRFVPTRRQRSLAAAIPGAISFDVAGHHAALVLGADEFVPVLRAACDSVVRRIDQAGRP
ncbi:MAG TPA: alpha/beta hydrolase [Mycobacteriales bacterium]|nr:alpha/beta hydrolase [Mycobacteriales bacterium]